uniref:Uncharacterized protein n=1 Tax=Arion vulgaris TaxID=1028688 RepID=A0A0B7BT58_9EUPU
MKENFLEEKSMQISYEDLQSEREILILKNMSYQKYLAEKFGKIDQGCDNKHINHRK